jgi:site-specific DNA-methyltransferase (adenine-specific)
MEKVRASRNNRTITVAENEQDGLKKRLFYPNKEKLSLDQIVNKTICGDVFAIMDLLPDHCVDLLLIDPPYNRDKNFHGLKCSKSTDEAYLAY